MKLRKSLVSLLLAAVMVLGLMPALAAGDTPLVVAYSPFSEKFSPYFADTAYDRDVADMTQLYIMINDRVGQIVYNAIEGETIPYNGKDYVYKGAADVKQEYDKEADITTYTAKIRDDLKFSDGEPVTADDIIFTYYVLLDPAYVGSTTLNSINILGLQDYRTQTSSAVYDKYAAMADGMLAGGLGHEWSDKDGWTKEIQDSFTAKVTELWKNDVQGIINTVNSKYASYLPDTLGFTAEEIAAEDGLKVAGGMALWGFGEADPATKVLTTASGKTFNLAEKQYPTLDDYFAEATAKYENSALKWDQAGETAQSGYSVAQSAKDAFIGEWGPKDTEMAGQGVPNIAGIRKLDQYSVEVKVKGFDATAIYKIFGVNITPMHYYGDKAQYDYEKNMFGHPFGDLSIAQAKSAVPMGAGAYKFVKYENRIVYFEANENYYLGAPKIKYIQFKETNNNEIMTAIQSGVVDVGDMGGKKENFETVAKLNSNGEISGDVVHTTKVDNLGYGYIGMNADNMNVGGVPDSEESKNLRRAFATLLSVYRDVTIDSYYGEAASVINYPISNTSWAAPQKSDPGYRVAYSVDVDGKDIYTADMVGEARYEAARQAAIGFFKAAGYTFDEAAGKFTAAPDGAKMSYEVIIPADGQGDHPAFGILTAVKADLEKMGIELKINDPADGNIMWDALDGGTQEMWCAAWGSTIDPDMYQVYHSNNIVGKGGSDSNHYHIADAKLDEAILNARTSDDQAFRKTVYKECLDIIIDWAVEVPTYQRQNPTLFSAQRVNIDTLTQDITPFWGWKTELEKLELK